VKLAFLAAALGLLASPLAAEVEIQRSGDRLNLTAVAAPLSDILDRLASQTGMRVVYDAQPPRQLVTARLDQRTTAEAVVGIMEGLGLNYALVMNVAGTRVDQLLVLGPVGVAAPSTAAARPTPASPRRPQPPELNFDDEPEEPPEDEFEEEDLTDAPEAPAPSAAPAGPPAPPPPDYPSSSFTPKLPTPTAPSPSAAPSGGGGPVPRPSPTPNPR
jgi:hypothetical protein